MNSSFSRSSRFRQLNRVSRLESLEARHLLANLSPVLTVDNDTLTYYEGKDALVAPNIELDDDNLNFGGGKLLLKGTENALKWDFLTLRNQGSGSGQVGLVNDSVTYGGVEIGNLVMKAPIVGEPTIYKQVDGKKLRAFIVNPPETNPPTTNRPAIILIHGGGWTSGGPGSLNEKAVYLASRGMVVVLIDYRLLAADSNDPPIPCIQDVKSAVRWVRMHAEGLGVDPNRIATGGGSVGGQMAAGAAMIDGLDDPNDNLEISSKSNAVMMFHAEIDNGPGRWGYGRVGNLYREISPAYNVSSDDPPVIAFYGENDTLIPADVRDPFAANMQAAGVRLDMHVFADQFHGFDSYAWDNPYFYSTLRLADEFFISLGWLSGEPTIEMPDSPPSERWEAESVIHFNANAVPAAMEAVLRNVRLATSKDPGDAVRTITLQLDDGDGGLSNVAVRHIGIIPVNNAPQVNLFGTARYVEGAPPFLLVPTTVILDPDSQVLSGASITVDYLDYSHPLDRLELQPSGTGPRQISLSNDVLLYEGVRVGTWSGGAGSTPLVIQFDNDIPLLFIQETIRRVSFRTIGVNPTALTRMVRFVVNDGGINGISQPAFKRVEVVPLNSPPVLDTSFNPRMKAILQGSKNTIGTSIAHLVANAIQDVDGKGQGVAITALGRVDQGVWQYSRNSGSSWQDVGEPPSNASALLLPGDLGTQLRFLPNATFTGDLKIYYRAWDRTQGVAGARWNLSTTARIGRYSAFSEALENAVLTVVPRSRDPQVNLGGSVNYTEKSPPVVLAAAATVTDPDSAHFAGGSLIVRMSENASAHDRLEIRNQGTGTRQIGVSGGAVAYGGVTIGTLSRVGQSLNIRFNNAATPSAVQALIRQVTFLTLGPNPSTATRSIVFVLRDGRGGTSAIDGGTKPVIVTAINDNPVLVLGGTIEYQRNAPAIALAAGALLSDADNRNFAGGELRVRIDSGSGAANRLGVGASFNVDVDNNVWFGGENIGRRNAGGGIGVTDLIVTFNVAAATWIVQRLVREVDFSTVEGEPGTRFVAFFVSDGAGGISEELFKTVNVV